MKAAVRIMLLFIVLLLALSGCGSEKAQEERGSPIMWSSYKEGLKRAQQTGRPLMLLFTSPHCRFCHYLEEITLRDSAVAQLLNEHFVSVKVDVSDNRELARKYMVSSFPTVWFLSSEGERIGMVLGYRSPEFFREVLQYIGSGSYKEMEFEEWINKKRASR